VAETPAAGVPRVQDGAGKTIGQYQLIARLGKGGMGSVFKARHQATGQIVAFKVLMPSSAHNVDLVLRFQRESKILLNLSHPNIVGGSTPGWVGTNLFYLAMEFVEASRWRSPAPREAPLPDRGDPHRRGHRGGPGLRPRAGAIHRDIKPENILLARGGAVKLCDLGLARQVEDVGFTMLEAPPWGRPRHVPRARWRG